MLLFDMKLYHGSDQHLEVIKPLGVNMGPRFSTPTWSSFWWSTYDEAKAWAVFQALRRHSKQRVYWHVDQSRMILIGDQGLHDAQRFLLGKKAFVYHVVLPRLKVGVGSSPDIREFTVDRDITPQKTDVITLDQDIVKTVAVVMSEAEVGRYIEDLKRGLYTNRRGFFLNLLLDRNRDFKRHKYHALIATGQLSPGDDLSKISIENRPPSSYW